MQRAALITEILSDRTGCITQADIKTLWDEYAHTVQAARVSVALHDSWRQRPPVEVARLGLDLLRTKLNISPLEGLSLATLKHIVDFLGQMYMREQSRLHLEEVDTIVFEERHDLVRRLLYMKDAALEDVVSAWEEYVDAAAHFSDLLMGVRIKPTVGFGIPRSASSCSLDGRSPMVRDALFLCTCIHRPARSVGYA